MSIGFCLNIKQKKGKTRDSSDAVTHALLSNDAEGYLLKICDRFYVFPRRHRKTYTRKTCKTKELLQPTLPMKAAVWGTCRTLIFVCVDI